MRTLLKRFASKIGIDKAIFFTSSSSIIGAFGSMISIILIVKYLSGVEQGFYYTFGSIVAIQIFFELGLNGIITQYVAHEASNLKWKNYKTLYGESKYLSRLSSLLHFSVKWYILFAAILLISLIVIGNIFFNKYDPTNGLVEWLSPWLLLSFGTALNLIFSPILAFLQGLSKVKEIARIRLIQQILVLIIIWGSLVLGAGLYVPGIGSLSGVFIIFTSLILSKHSKILKTIWETKIIERVNYFKEIFPFQWKIALSWISGYFIFQLFNPVLFATEGAIVAGQMGMTLAVLNGILSLSITWITTKIPLFSGLIAQKMYSELDSIFNKTLRQSSFINLILLLILTIMIFIMRYFNIEIEGKLLGDRFLDYIPLFLMMIPVFINQFVSSWATYLRCHKKEPFLVNSITGGILCLLSTTILGKYFGLIGVTFGYCIITLLISPWGYYIFKTKKKKWHDE